MVKYAFRLGAKIYITSDLWAPVPIKDMKLLRDQLAQMIGENKRLASKLEAAEVSNAEMALTMDQMALSMDQTVLELNLISVQRDEAPAKVELLEKALREVTEGNIKIEKILQYYDNPHTQPDHHRARDQQAKEGGVKKGTTPPGARGAIRDARTLPSAAGQLIQ